MDDRQDGLGLHAQRLGFDFDLGGLDSGALIEPPAVVTEADWLRCEPLIKRALKYARGTHTTADVLAEIAANRATFWPFTKSVAVTQLVDWPSFRQMHYWLVGGDLKELLSHEAAVTEWGRRHGATRVTTTGRPGWRRVMKPLGYEFLVEICSKELPPMTVH